jgi:hypothetical protein
VEAIASGVQPGLTMVVGPPGTGKTDTAVQIMTVLYHNCPGQRTLLITHSNQVSGGARCEGPWGRLLRARLASAMAGRRRARAELPAQRARTRICICM